MQTFVEYQLDGDTTLLIYMPSEEAAGIIEASSKKNGSIILRSEKKFAEALKGIETQAKILKKTLEEMRADEVEVKFGLTTSGKAGNFAIGTVGLEANYQVTLRWKNSKKTKFTK